MLNSVASREMSSNCAPIPSRTTNRRTSSTSSQRVRNNFLSKLGVGQKPHNFISTSERSSRDIRDMPRLSEPLHYDRDEERLREEHQEYFRPQSPSSVANDIPARELENVKKKRVNFYENVTVVLIPKSFEYSSRVQAKLFHDSIEASEDVERNIVEFNADNRDWSNVCLEDNMHVCDTGELIHPVHIQQNESAFGSTECSPQPHPFSQEWSKYWRDRNVI